MTRDSELSIGVVLPDKLGTYSDAGNAVVLAQRALWRGVGARIEHLTADRPPATGCDLYLVGGGEDTAQTFGIEWLARHPELRHAMAGTAVTFAVCAGLQILGHTLVDAEGRRHAGAGLLDVWTSPRRRRAVGEVLARCELPDVGMLTGFENHRGGTVLGPGVRPLGRVRAGVGNGGGHADRFEGAVAGRVLATYLHGPVLARNPSLADHLLRLATGTALPDLPEPPDVTDLRRTYLAAGPVRRHRARPWRRSA